MIYQIDLINLLLALSSELQLVCGNSESDVIVGQFSRPQREIYEALLEVQEACLRLVYPGALTLNDIYSEMLLMLGRQLQRLGVVPKELIATRLLQVCTV